jgi:hypothetical protein
MHVPFISEIEKQERANDIFKAVTWVLAIAAVAVAVMLLCSGCSTLFGEPAWTQPATYAPDGTMTTGTLVYEPTTGLVQQAAAVAQGTGTPWGIVIAGALGLLTTVVQTIRVNGRLKPSDVAVEITKYEADPPMISASAALQMNRTAAAVRILRAMKPKGV